MKVSCLAPGLRLDAALAEQSGLSRSAVQRLIAQGNVTKNGAPVSKNEKTEAAAVYEISVPPPQPSEAKPQQIALDIVYEDADIIVVNKPKGMVVHPAAGHADGTLVNALLFHCPQSLSGIGGVMRPGIVHRIDKDTAGLLMVAKNDAAHIALSEQIREHTFLREYRAVVLGNLREDSGFVDAAIARHPTDRKRMAISTAPAARQAYTAYRVLRRFWQYTYIACTLKTGRTHQIRVHMSSIGHPLLGDTVYGGGGTPFEKKLGSLLCGQCLFAAKLGFVHPRTGEYMSFEAPLPADFAEILRRLAQQFDPQE